LVVGLVGVLVLVVSVASAALALNSHVLPPSGTIAFGTSFDSWSGVQGQAATLSPTQPIVAVADFNGKVNGGDQISVLVDGTPVGSWTASGGKSGPVACEIDFALGELTTGQHRVEVLGANGTELASGTISVGN
jgi:hypothetical protein